MNEIVLIAHNIRSLWNIGSLFRTSDCFNVQKLYLTGYTATPPRREITKTALGAEEWVPWEYHENPVELVESLKKDGWTIASLELDTNAINVQAYEAPDKIAIILGQEVTGVPQELLKLSNVILQIPMFGKKESLNVTVAAGIALHQLR